MLKNDYNQKFKLIVKDLGIGLYSNNYNLNYLDFNSDNALRKHLRQKNYRGLSVKNVREVKIPSPNYS